MLPCGGVCLPQTESLPTCSWYGWAMDVPLCTEAVQGCLHPCHHLPCSSPELACLPGIAVPGITPQAEDRAVHGPSGPCLDYLFHPSPDPKPLASAGEPNIDKHGLGHPSLWLFAEWRWGGRCVLGAALRAPRSSPYMVPCSAPSGASSGASEQPTKNYL